MCQNHRLPSISLLIILIVIVIPNLNSEQISDNCTLTRQERSLLDIITLQPISDGITGVGRAISSVIDVIPHLLLQSALNGVLPSLIGGNIPLFIIKLIVRQFKSAKKNEDITLNITQLISKYDYKNEVHTVQTIDGYKLNMFRIPNDGPPVFLMHGLLSSSDDWITNGPENSIAYLLASEGYDVWLGNARGNKHSRQHVRLSPDHADFWDFSWDEIGRYDLPAMIDHVLKVTNKKKLSYVGHSQGTTSFFVMCSDLPEYNDKISLMIALSPVVFMSNLKSPIIRLLSPLNPFLYSVLMTFGAHEFLPSSNLINTVASTMCGKGELAEIFCSNIVFLICGFDRAQLNVTNLPVLFGHVPAGAATKQLVHYAQGIVSGKFQRFNYGKRKNKQRYVVEEPNSYPIERVTAPVAMFYSENDWLASVEDVQTLRGRLKNVVEFYKIPFQNFNHIDFIWAKDLKSLIFFKMRQLLQKYTTST